jgi:uncharacterized protein (DUF362 family)
MVVIKPNITADSISWRQGIVTNPHLVHAIIEIVAERNPRKILIADGTVAGEGDEPMANSPVGFQTLLAGTNNRIVDTVSARVMGFEPDEIEILKICDELREMAGVDKIFGCKDGYIF